VDVLDPKDLKAALRRHEFVLAFQPIVHISTGEVPAVEALIRWRHPKLGMLQPGSFLSLITSAGLSDQLTKFGLFHGLRALPQLRNTFGTDVAVSVNLARAQLQDPVSTAKLIYRYLDRAQEPATSLRIEVVEDLSVDDFERSTEALNALRDLGVKVVLDDFGTGASSLSMLTNLDYDALKIDRSFTNRMLSSAPTHSVIQSILTFAKATATDVVVEGVETEEQLHELRSIGCELAQGYLLGRPALLDDLTPIVVRVATGPQPEQPQVQLQPIDALSAAVEAINPRRVDMPNCAILEELELLNEQAVALGDQAITQRLEIGRRLTLAAIYGGNTAMVTKWALHTSRLAEEVDEWGYSAEVLAVLASCPGASSDYAGVRIDSLTQAMRLRISKPMGGSQSSRIDNSIGSAFANLGLFNQALAWWSDSIERHRLRRDAGTAMVCLNLAEIQMQMLEDELPGCEEVPLAARTAQVYSTLAMLDQNSSAPVDGSASIRCRLELHLGNPAGAAESLAGCRNASTDILSQFLVLRARAMLAQAEGRTSDFLAHTTTLLDVLGRQPLLSHFARAAERLHGVALLTAGKTDEGIDTLHGAYRSQMVNDGAKIALLFEWIRLHIDLETRFGSSLQLAT